MEINLKKQFFYRVQEGDTILSICKKFNTGKDNILRNNNNIPVYEGEFIRITVNDYITHVVKPVDTLSKIAEQYNLNKEKILKDNNLETDKLFIGQIIKIYKQN